MLSMTCLAVWIRLIWALAVGPHSRFCFGHWQLCLNGSQEQGLRCSCLRTEIRMTASLRRLQKHLHISLLLVDSHEVVSVLTLPSAFLRNLQSSTFLVASFHPHDSAKCSFMRETSILECMLERFVIQMISSGSGFWFWFCVWF